MKRKLTSTKVEGQEVKIGDRVGFKSDIEQSGRIVGIYKDGHYPATLVLENPNGFEGGYIGGQTITEEYADDCWV